MAEVVVTPGTKEDLARAPMLSRVATASANGEGIVLTPPNGTRLHTIRPRYDLVKKNLRGSLSAFRIKKPTITRENLSDEASRLYKMFSQEADAADQANNGYTQFLLQGTSLVFQEKAQVVTTAGDNDVVYYFGRTPTQLTIQGMLIDDADNDWFTGFVTAYNTIMRGTQLARNFEVIELSTPSVNYVGTVMNLSLGQNSQVEQLVQFSMTLLLKEVTPITVSAWGKKLSQNAGEFEAVQWTDSSKWSTAARNQYAMPEEFSTNEEAEKDEYNALFGVFTPSTTLDPAFSTMPVEKPEHAFSSEYVSVVSGVRSTVLDSIKSIDSAILATANAGANLLTDFASFATAPLAAVEDIASGITSLINAAESASDQLVDALLAPHNQLLAAEDALKGMVGTITAMPETISETIARAMGDDTYGIPTFAGGKSLSSADAMAILKDVNQRDPSKTPIVGAPSTAESSGDEIATLSF